MTPEQYAALKAEAALPAYAGMDDAAIAAALMVEAVPIVRDVQTADAREILLATGEWGGVVMLARMTPSAEVPAQVIAAAITAEDTLRLTETLQTSDPTKLAAVEALLGVLVAAGAISAGTRDALLALRHATISRVAQLGLGRVTAADVQTAKLT